MAASLGLLTHGIPRLTLRSNGAQLVWPSLWSAKSYFSTPILQAKYDPDMQDTPTFRELRRPYPTTSLDVSIFEDKSEEYGDEAIRAPRLSQVQTEDSILLDAIRYKKWGDAVSLCEEFERVGLVLKPQYAYFKAAHFFLDYPDVTRMRRATFLRWWHLSPDVNYHHETSWINVGRITAKVLHCHAKSQLTMRDIFHFGLIGARKGYAPALAKCLLPYVLTSSEPTRSWGFYLQFEEEAMKFASSAATHLPRVVHHRRAHVIASYPAGVYPLVISSLRSAWRALAFKVYLGSGHEEMAQAVRRNSRKLGIRLPSVGGRTSSKARRIVNSIPGPQRELHLQEGQATTSWTITELAKELRRIRTLIDQSPQPPLAALHVSSFIQACEAADRFRALYLLRARMMRRPEFIRVLWLHAELLAYKESGREAELLNMFSNFFVPHGLRHAQGALDFCLAHAQDYSRYVLPAENSSSKVRPTSSVLALVWHAMVALISKPGTPPDIARVESLYTLLLRPLRHGHYRVAMPFTPSIYKPQYDITQYFDDDTVDDTRLSPSLKPSGAFFDPFITFFGTHVSPQRVIGVLNDMRSFGIVITLHNWTGLLHAYARVGDTTNAFAILDRMSSLRPERGEGQPVSDFYRADAVAYTAAMEGFIFSKEFDAAREVADRLWASGYVQGSDQLTDDVLTYLASIPVHPSGNG